MRRIKFILFILVLFAGQAFAQNADDKSVTVNGKKFYQHIVKKGETVYGLSKDYNVAARDIVMENPKAMEGISAGDTLRIPLASASTALPEASGDKTQGGYIYHKVVAKETLYSLSKQYNTRISLLDSLNPDLKAKGLLVGQNLKIPAPHSASQQTVQTPTPVVTPTITPVQKTIVQTAPSKDTAKERQAFKNLVNQQHIDTTKKQVVNNQPIIMPPKPVLTQTVTPTPIAVVDRAKLKNKYNVALIMPFTSENADTIKMNRLLDGTEQLPLYSQISSDFYQGTMIALDSLEKKGVSVDLHLYNITSTADTSAYRLDSILKDPAFALSDLIIGPPSTAHFKKVAAYAAMHNIPIVSPIVSDNVVVQTNAFASKVTPSSVTEIEKMADFVTAHYSKSNVILLHHRDAADEVYFENFKKRYTANMQVYGEKDSVTVADYSDNLEIMGKKIQPNKNNVIVVPYQGASFVAKLVNRLANSKYADDDSIVLFGMHNWLNNDNLDMADLDTLNFHFPSNDYVNYSDSCTKGFIRTYRSNFYTEPSYYACQGFDIAYFYIGLLGKYGTDMQNHLSDTKYNGVHTCIDMKRVGDTGGYDNSAIYILEYKNYAVLRNAR
ncbi:MAG TPA: LysM peptidoglycan-binding domain-containing protein [Bacteroidia bacterium]|nr:LysM peptidoglycan-binding domain-containing protein [Bacteroidia bacterium]